LVGHIRKGFIIYILSACILLGLTSIPGVTHASTLTSTIKVTDDLNPNLCQSVTLIVTANSSVNLLVTDPGDSSIGYDAGTNKTVNEITGAVYSGPFTEPQVIEIPNPISGYSPYKIAASSYEDGPYQISFQLLDSTGEIIDNATRTRSAWTGVTYFFTLQQIDCGTISSITPAQDPGSYSPSPPESVLHIPESAFAGTAALMLIFLIAGVIYMFAGNRKGKETIGFRRPITQIGE